MTGSAVAGFVRHNAVGLLALFVALGGTSYAAGVRPFVGRAGKISACVDATSGSLRLVRPGLRCQRRQVSVTWNQKGQPGHAGINGTNGTNGTNGVSVTGASVGAGDSNCPTGGSRFTTVSGVSYACNGAKGDLGPVGPSNSYQATQDANVALSNSFSSKTTIASLTLPGPATYLVSASGGVSIGGGVASNDVVPEIARDGTRIVFQQIGNAGPESYAMTRLIAVTGASSVISIRAYAQTSGTANAFSNSLVATLVGSGSGAS